MISKTKKRINVTLDRSLVDLIQEAAGDWGLTVSEYLSELARVDIMEGLTAQARIRAGSNTRVNMKEDI